jgi:hypothetical protein
MIFLMSIKKTTDEYTQNVGKILKANIAAEFEKQKKSPGFFI